MAQFKCIRCSSDFDDDISGIVYCPYCSEIQPLPMILTEEQKEAVYEHALMVSDTAKSPSNIKDAVYIFEQLDGYREASRHAERCRAKLKDFENDAIYAEALQKMELETISGYKEAIELLSKIPEWKNASFKLDEANLKLDELIQKREDKLDKISKLTMLVCGILVFLGIATFLIVEFLTPVVRYSRALNLIEKENYDKAYAILEDLGDYKNAANEIKKSKYERAQKYFQEKDYLNACKYFGEAKGYADADAKCLESIKKGSLSVKDQISVLGVGNSVIFGFYEQDGNEATDPSEKEPIEWIILDKNGSEALLAAKYGIEAMAFSQEPCPWSQSEIRAWLNGEFYTRKFLPSERNVMVNKPTVTFQTTETGEEVRDISNDYIFLLSNNEAKKYFSLDDGRAIYATQYLKDTGIYVNPDNSRVHYWLRSIASSGDVMYVNASGAINETGRDGDHVLCVRPAVWVKYN